MRCYFAPMEGVTGWLYRRAHHTFFGGVDRYYMPFFSPTQNHLLTPRMGRDIDPKNNEGIPVVPQLLTKNADDFLWGARALESLGYDEVNLNLGCPSGTVVAKGKGAGFLGHLDELARFLDAIFAASPLPISIKTRLGMYEPAEFAEILALYNRYPLAELIIHPRVRAELYRGQPHRDVFEQALPQVRCPVCYNGDLMTTADCAAFFARFPTVDTIMIGRGLLADPALARQLRGGAPADRATLTAFHDTLYASYCQAFGSDRNAMFRMKELWSYLICRFEGGEALEKRLKKAPDARAYEQAAAEILRTLPLTESPCHFG